MTQGCITNLAELITAISSVAVHYTAQSSWSRQMAARLELGSAPSQTSALLLLI